MKDNDAATEWAVDYLESHDCRLVTIQKIVEPAHSIVKKISTSQPSLQKMINIIAF